ncbi:phage tail length tape measure family protein [Rhizobium wenxiniae]|uniref:phage tail length tape measure family protein n=1 Tax=Rhizobium wenxiniae TaxID=1737357 RepID=UPI003C269E5A
MEGSAGATSRNAASSATATTELKKLDAAAKSAAASQKGLRSSVDATTNSLSQQGRNGRGRGSAGGEDADVTVYGLKPWQLVNLGYQVNDVVSGLAMGQAPLQVLAQQAGQFAQIWPNVMVGLARSIPQLTLLTTALAPFIAAALRLKEAGDSVEYFNSRLNASADGYRYTAEGLAEIAKQVKETGVSIDDARKMVAGFAAKGISDDQFSGLAQLAKDLSDLSGQDVVEAGSKLADAFSGSVDDVRDLDKELNFLTASQYEQIRAMDAAGNRAGALALAQDALGEKLEDGRGKASEWTLALKELKGAWNDLVSALEDSGVIAFVVREIDYAGRDLKNVVKDIRGAANAIGQAFNEMTPDERILQLRQQIATEEANRANGGLASGAAGMTGEDNLAQMKSELADILSYQRELKRLDQERTVSSAEVTTETEAQKKAMVDVAATVSENLSEIEKESSAVDATNRERFIEQRLLKARNEALERAKQLNQDFLGLTQEQNEAIRQQAGALYDKQQYLGENAPGTGAFADRVGSVESGGNASARNPNSTATGLGQFIESTWLRMFKQYFPDQARSMTNAAILALREDSKISRNMIELYAKENAKTLDAAGVAVTDASLYLSHFLGPQGAVAVLTAKADTPVSELLSSATINANKSVLQGKTAGQVSNWAQGKMGGSDVEVETQARLNELDLERVATQKEYLGDYQKRVEQQQFELDLMSKSAREAAISKAVHAEELKAKEAGVELTKEQRAETEKLAATEFDRQNVNLEVNKLMEQRQALLERIELARDTGDQSLLGSTATELEGVNAKLNEAIAKAIAFWQAMGGEQSQNAVMQLQNMQMQIGQSVDKMQTQFLPRAEEINEQLAEIGRNAFSAFAEAIAKGENAADAFFNALMQGIAEFLIDIGKAIVKQALFNMLSGGSGAGGGVGGGIGGALLGLFGAKHTGGIVGESGMTRMVNPMVFAGAQRYHGGGVIGNGGLKRNEVPIIALQEEEVITPDDARHSKNGGGRSSVNLKNVNVFDPADVLQAALETIAGEKIMMNFMTRNAGKVNGALGS